MKIDLRNISLSYGETHALNAITASIEGPGIVGLLGRNGSGKTSLLSVMAALRKPNTGETTYNGQPVWENATVTSQVALIREGGDTPDEDSKIDDVLRYAAWLRPDWNDDLARDLLDAFQVPQSTHLNAMSRGQRSAVGVVLGLAAQAPVTMFDETYLGMDAPTRVLFYDLLLREYIDRPRTFIISSHLIDEIAKILSDVVIIDRGEVLIQAPIDDLLGQGVAITGPADRVDAFVAGHQVIGQRDLGRTRSAMVFGRLSAEQRLQAREAGLEIDSLDLQDLFVHLTRANGKDGDA